LTERYLKIYVQILYRVIKSRCDDMGVHGLATLDPTYLPPTNLHAFILN